MEARAVGRDWRAFIAFGMLLVSGSMLLGFANPRYGPVGASTCLTFDAAPSAASERCYGQVTGVVFFDINRNGVRDPGEPGKPGIDVTLMCACENRRLKTTTDGLGNFSFPPVSSGLYYVETHEPSGFVPIGPTKVNIDVACGGSVLLSFANKPNGVLGAVATPVATPSATPTPAPVPTKTPDPSLTLSTSVLPRTGSGPPNVILEQFVPPLAAAFVIMGLGLRRLRARRRRNCPNSVPQWLSGRRMRPRE